MNHSDDCYQFWVCLDNTSFICKSGNFKNGDRNASSSAEFWVLLEIKLKQKMVYGHDMAEKEGNFCSKRQRQKAVRQDQGKTALAHLLQSSCCCLAFCHLIPCPHFRWENCYQRLSEMKIYGVTQGCLSNAKRDGKGEKKIDFYPGWKGEIMNTRIL